MRKKRIVCTLEAGAAALLGASGMASNQPPESASNEVAESASNEVPENGYSGDRRIPEGSSAERS